MLAVVSYFHSSSVSLTGSLVKVLRIESAVTRIGVDWQELLQSGKNTKAGIFPPFSVKSCLFLSHSYTALYIIFVKPHDQVWQDDIFETLIGISPSQRSWAFPLFREHCLGDWMDSRRQRQKGPLPGFWISAVCALRTGRVYYKAKYSEETMN